MKTVPSRILVCAVFTMSVLARAVAGDLPAYRQLSPMVSIYATSLSDAIRILNDGLAGSGVETKPSDCETRLADACFLPSFSGVDLRRPVQCFFLSQNPPLGMPEQAVILPLQPAGAHAFLRSLRERYVSVEGSNIKICAEPRDGKSIEPLYVAIAEGNAMLSPNVDAIRWMAYNLQAKTVPPPPDFRRTPLSVSADAKSLGLLLELVASLDEGGSAGKEAAEDDIFLHIRELGVVFSAFQRVEMTLDASISQWDAAFRFAAAPGGTIAETIAALKPPDDSWMEFFPTFACNRSASCLPGFIAALPPSNRKWLADLADNTRLFGHGVFPSAFDLDEKIRPFATGTALSTFVTDKPGDKFGSITISSLKSPQEAQRILRGYFAANGAASANKRIDRSIPQGRNGAIAYNVVTDRGGRQKTGVGAANEAVSFLLELDHVELGIRGDRLVIARGAPGLIAPWLAGEQISPWDEKVSSLTAVFPNQPGETVLGGGSTDPVALARKIVEAIPDLAGHLQKMPHAGSGLAWRMSRRGGEARFDLRLYGNEIVAINRLRVVNSDTLQQLLPRLMMHNFQPSPGDGMKSERLRQKLNELREK